MIHVARAAPLTCIRACLVHLIRWKRGGTGPRWLCSTYLLLVRQKQITRCWRGVFPDKNLYLFKETQRFVPPNFTKVGFLSPLNQCKKGQEAILSHYIKAVRCDCGEQMILACIVSAKSCISCVSKPTLSPSSTPLYELQHKLDSFTPASSVLPLRSFFSNLFFSSSAAGRQSSPTSPS